MKQGLLALVLTVLAAPSWAALAIEHWTQDSGAGVWLASSMNIPMVDVRVEFDAGSRFEPAQKTGMVDLLAAVTPKGVQAWQDEEAHDAAALGNAWAELGAQFNASSGNDTFSFSLRSLTYEDILPEAVSLATHQLAAPAFDEAVFERERERTIASIGEAETRPSYVANKRFRAAVFGEHPYGRTATAETLQAVQLADLRDYYQQQVRACRARVSIVGAVTRQQADELVENLLAGIQRDGDCPELAAPADPQPLQDAEVIRIPFDTSQAHVLLGQLSIKRSDPDFLTMLVGNHILGGGGFVSRLTEEVREKRGLSYSVYSYFAPRANVGEFVIGLQTKSEQAQEAEAVAMDVLRDFVANGPTEEELQAAKDNLIGGFALRIDSNRKLLNNIANIARNDLPLDYLETWTDHVAEISVADINDVFQSRIKPNKMVNLILGVEPPTATESTETE